MTGHFIYLIVKEKQCVICRKNQHHLCGLSFLLMFSKDFQSMKIRMKRCFVFVKNAIEKIRLNYKKYKSFVSVNHVMLFDGIQKTRFFIVFLIQLYVLKMSMICTDFVDILLIYVMQSNANKINNVSNQMFFQRVESATVDKSC